MIDRMVITVEVGGEKFTINKLLFQTPATQFPAVADYVWKDMLTALSEKFV